MLIFDQEATYIVIAAQSLLGIWAAVLSWNEKLKQRRHLALSVTIFFIAVILLLNVWQSKVKSTSDQARNVEEQTRRHEARLDSERLASTVAEVGRVTKLNTELQSTLLSTSRKIAKMSSNTYDQLTGGDTYPEVTPIFLIESSKGYALTMSGVGAGPLVNASYSLTLGEPPVSLSQEQLKKIVEDTLNGSAPAGEIFLGTIPWRNGRILQDHIRPSSGGPNVYRIGMRTANGTYYERLEVRFDPSVPGSWDYRDEVKRDIGLNKYGTVVLKKMPPWVFRDSQTKMPRLSHP